MQELITDIKDRERLVFERRVSLIYHRLLVNGWTHPVRPTLEFCHDRTAGRYDPFEDEILVSYNLRGCSDDEIAFVVGHELGHARDFRSFGVLRLIGDFIYKLPREYRADRFARELSNRAGFQAGWSFLWKRSQVLWGREFTLRRRKRIPIIGRLVGWLESHPMLSERVNALYSSDKKHARRFRQKIFSEPNA